MYEADTLVVLQLPEEWCIAARIPKTARVFNSRDIDLRGKGPTRGTHPSLIAFIKSVLEHPVIGPAITWGRIDHAYRENYSFICFTIKPDEENASPQLFADIYYQHFGVQLRLVPRTPPPTQDPEWLDD